MTKKPNLIQGDDEREWIVPEVPPENKEKQRQQAEDYPEGTVGFNPMARDPDTGELLHPRKI
jgi:hypothetical protein